MGKMPIPQPARCGSVVAMLQAEARGETAMALKRFEDYGFVAAGLYLCIKKTNRRPMPLSRFEGI